MLTLKDIPVGESAHILHIGGDGALRQHFLDMGVIPGAFLTVTKLAPMGDPMEIRIHGYELTLRLEDAAKIDVEKAGHHHHHHHEDEEHHEHHHLFLCSLRISI